MLRWYQYSKKKNIEHIKHKRTKMFIWTVLQQKKDISYGKVQ